MALFWKLVSCLVDYFSSNTWSKFSSYLPFCSHFPTPISMIKTHGKTLEYWVNSKLKKLHLQESVPLRSSELWITGPDSVLQVLDLIFQLLQQLLVNLLKSLCSQQVLLQITLQSVQINGLGKSFTIRVHVVYSILKIQIRYIQI